MRFPTEPLFLSIPVIPAEARIRKGIEIYAIDSGSPLRFVRNDEFFGISVN